MKALFYILLFLGHFLLFSCTKKIYEKDLSISKKQHNQLAEYTFSDGMKDFVLEKYSQAQTSFEKALSLNPEIYTANFMLSRIYLKKGKTEEALIEIKKAIKGQPKNKYYHLHLAHIYEGQMKYAEAVNTYNDLIKEAPGSEEHYYDLAAGYIFLSNYTEALNAYNKIENIFGRSSELTKQKQQLFLKINELDKAINEGEQYIKEFPEDYEFKINQAEILYSNNKTEEAKLFLEEFIKENPNVGQARLLLSDVYGITGMVKKQDEELHNIFSNGEIDLETKLTVISDLSKKTSTEQSKKSIEKFADQILENHSSDPKALMAAGDIFYLISNNKNKAWKEYIKAKELNPSDYNLWNKVIQLDGELNEIDSMILHSDQALESFPNNAMFWLFKGTGYQMKKQESEAINVLEQGLRLANGQNEMVLEFNTRLGDAYNAVKEFDKSDKAFEEVLRIDVNNDYVLNNYSYYLAIRKDKLEAAEEMAERLVKKNPVNSSYLDTFAWVLYVKGDYERAKKYLELATANSNNATILEHYGDVLFKLGQKESAMEQWLKAKQLGDTSDLLEKKINDKFLYEH